MAVTLNASSSGTGGLSVTSDATGNLAFQTAGTTAVTVDSSQNVGIGTASPASRLNLAVGASTSCTMRLTSNNTGAGAGDRGRLDFYSADNSGVAYQLGYMDYDRSDGTGTASYIAFANRVSGTVAERMRIDGSGTLLIAKTTGSDTVAGITLGNGSGDRVFTVGTSASWGVMVNRQDNDGTLINFRQNNTDEGSISVSGTTVSYNGGHLSRYAQTTTAKDESLVKGTVLSNLDAMNVYTAPTTYWTEEDELPEGVNVGDVKVETHEVANEQLNKVKVSDVEGDANVAGVFVNWSYDEAHQVDEINMAMTGDMIIRIAQGVTVQRGDLLMSAGDGTAKTQSDDIVRSKTIAKVTSNHVTCTYEDGSYCVPCVLMAC